MKAICCVCVKALSLLYGVQAVYCLLTSLAHQAGLCSFLNQLAHSCYLLLCCAQDDDDLQMPLLGRPCSLLPALQGGGDLRIPLVVPCFPLPLIPPAQDGGDLQMPAAPNLVDGCAVCVCPEKRRGEVEMEGGGGGGRGREGCIWMRNGEKQVDVENPSPIPHTPSHPYRTHAHTHTCGKSFTAGWAHD